MQRNMTSRPSTGSTGDDGRHGDPRGSRTMRRGTVSLKAPTLTSDSVAGGAVATHVPMGPAPGDVMPSVSTSVGTDPIDAVAATREHQGQSCTASPCVA